MKKEKDYSTISEIKRKIHQNKKPLQIIFLRSLSNIV